MPLLVLLLLTATDRNPQVSAAIDRYESAELRNARDALLELVGAPGLSAADQADVRAYLAACYLGLSDPGSARLQLRELAREHPEAKPSPASFGPDLIRIANEVWAEAEKRVVKEPPAAVPVEPPVALQLEPTPSRPPAPSRLFALVPFGVGHFVRGDRMQGAVMLGLEALLLGTAAVSVGVLESMKSPSAPRSLFWEGSVDDAHYDTAQNLNLLATITFFSGLAVIAIEIGKALVTWPADSG